MSSLEIRTQRIFNNLIKQNQKLDYDSALKHSMTVSSVQSPASKVKHPVSRVQHLESSVQCPASSFQSPATRVQSPGSRVQHPVFRIQGPGSRIQMPASRVQRSRSNTWNSGGRMQISNIARTFLLKLIICELQDAQ